ncbi:hypothetical protein, partial [Xenorhabdus griffiniae]|uniref:hypothetical protein n=1 Tax=Xenorhabdus griffiniae TaxID=351672 RepID=UPI001CB8D4A5
SVVSLSLIELNTKWNPALVIKVSFFVNYIICYQLLILLACNMISSLPIRCAVGEIAIPRNGKMIWQMTQY